MILTGTEIINEVHSGNIVINPFNPNQINPNSYNYRIGKEILVLGDNGQFVKEKIPDSGLILQPHTVYLANTYEVLGSKKYAMSLIGRSSLGRLGLFLQISANLGHTGSVHRWTLELVAAKHIKIFPNMLIGQLSFWENKGELISYKNGYSLFSQPKTSLLRF